MIPTLYFGHRRVFIDGSISNPVTDRGVSMLHHTTRRYLTRSGFTEMQSEALADLASEIDLGVAHLDAKFEHRIYELDANFDRRINELDAKLERQIEKLLSHVDARIANLSTTFATKEDLARVETRIRRDVNAMEARLTWRFVALTAFLGTVLSLVNIFVA